jgi:thymidine kinase
MNNGYLELILGPMFSGKTTRLVEIYNKHTRSAKSVVAINFAKDTRYHDTMLSTHDKVFIPCIFAEKINSLLSHEDVINANVILINEGQFFEDIYDSVITLVEKMHKKIYICGLDGDFKRNKFGNLLDLIPYCDAIVKLRSNCTKCNNDAIFSHRISCEQNQVVIGSDNYMPLCRKCYHTYTTIA